MATEDIVRKQWSFYVKLGEKENDNGHGDLTVKLRNIHISKQPGDYLYHLALGTDDDLKTMFGDVKFVCMGGKAPRMKSTALTIMDEIKYSFPVGATLKDLTERSNRFSMYKVGPVLCVSHGMGEPSITILLHEIIKLLYHARAQDPIFFRIGTSGGVGVDPGTVVIAKKAVNGYLEEHYSLPILGQTIKRPAILHEDLAKDLVHVASDMHFPVATATTMSALDFYEGQGRLDGAFCNYTEAEKLEFLQKAFNKGVRNIEMEAAAFSAITYHAGIKSALLNVTFLDRLQEDQVLADPSQLEEWELRPQKIVAQYIKLKLEKIEAK